MRDGLKCRPGGRRLTRWRGEAMRRLVAAVVVGWLTVLPAAAEPVAREQVPEALRPWTDWVMHGHEEAFCSLLQGSTDHRQCAWPSRLTLDLDTRAGRFTQDWLVQRAGWVPLPGDPARAPLDVRADGKPAAVTFRSGVPRVRPGTWVLELAARHEGPASALTLSAAEGPWGAEEVWVFDARPDLRLASVEGVPVVDPQQTELPEEWRQLPAYRLAPGSTMRLVEKRRGDSDPAPDRLSLQRTWWLDFDGGGFTVKDQISGTTSRSWRLGMAAPTVLRPAAVDGREQFLTRVGDRSSVGIELREGQLQLEADSRIEGAVSRVPAVGWDHDFQGVNAQLNLPPGWQLYYASGVDGVSSSWVTNWTLLDLFVVLIVAMAVGRLSSWRWGLVALATLALTYPESMAPRWLWLAVLAGDALVRALPEGRPLRWAKVFRLGALVVLVMIALGFAADPVRVGL